MNRSSQIKFRQWGVIIIVWLIIGMLISVHDWMVLLGNPGSISSDYSFWVSFAINIGAAIFGAIFGGAFMVFYVNVRYQDKPYGYTILSTSIVFMLIIASVAVIMAIILAPEPTVAGWWATLKRMAPRTVKNIIVWSVVVGVTQLMLQVNSKFGQAAFWNIIRGKYNTPKQERRIFMCLDLNASTKMAEQLGNEKYHSLLKDFFADITQPILNNKGEIYQYVGDEVVVAWNYEDGLENRHCVKCFFDTKWEIQRQREKYLRKYGLVPAFKAGIHCGSVIAGEIGIIKRDITYSGDVLNTTSRILNKCGEFNAEIIASADLLSELSIATHYISRPLGAIKLKGKEKELLLNALLPMS